MNPVISETNNSFFLSADSVEKYNRVWINDQWKYHPGDNLQWADPDFNDSGWEIVDTRLTPDNFPESGWTGIGWFRVHLKVDSTLIGEELGFVILGAGAAEVYLDGKHIESIGTISRDQTGEIPRLERNPKLLSGQISGQHVLAIRYSNHSTSSFKDYRSMSGFSFLIGKMDQLIKARTEDLRSASIFQMLFMIIPLTLAVLHIFLFFFDMRSKKNLYYVLFLIFFTAFVYINYQSEFVSKLSHSVLFFRLAPGVLSFTILFGNMTIHSIFLKLPKYYFGLMIGALALGLAGYYFPGPPVWYVTYAFIMAVSVIGGTVLFSCQKLIEGGEWIIRTGFIIMAIAGIYQMVISLEIIPPIAGITQMYLFGVIAFLISMSISLARDYALTSRNLEKQLVQVKELSNKTLEQERRVKEQEMQQRLLQAENDRKTKELEEARQLQLSMLPDSQGLNDIPGIDICFHMQTATEVGGDYYDYIKKEDGTIVIAIGDATGHGMKAGTLVSVIKSLFIAEGANSNFPEFLMKISQIIKQMKLGNLYMGLTLLNIQDHQLRFASAGMPPIFIYRTRSKKVEELTHKKLPLGAPTPKPYHEEKVSLESGDVVLLMTDGFPELFNANEEVLDYHRVKSLFIEAVNGTSQDIIQHLLDAGTQWQNGTPQNDDITFISIKINKNTQL